MGLPSLRPILVPIEGRDREGTGRENALRDREDVGSDVSLPSLACRRGYTHVIV